MVGYALLHRPYMTTRLIQMLQLGMFWGTQIIPVSTRSAKGLAGQNMETPSEKVFSSHTTVKPESSSLYFDPSYGVTYLNEFYFEKDSISGYAAQIGFDENGYYIYKVKKTEGKGNVRFSTLKTFP